MSTPPPEQRSADNQPVTEIGALVADGQRLFQAGSLAEATAAFRRALHLNPDHPVALNILGIIYHLTGDPEAGLRSIKRAVAVAPDYPQAHYNLGNAYKERGELEAAAECFRKAAAIAPDFVTAHNNLGVVLLLLNRHEEAAAAFRRAIDLRPDYADAHANLSNALKGNGMADAAIASLRRALELRPDHPEYLADLGAILHGAGHHDEALAPLQRAVALAPGLARAHNNLGAVLDSLGRNADALRCFEQAAQLDPRSVDPLVNGATVLRRTNRLQEALVRLQRAGELDPAAVAPRFMAGEILATLGDLDGAASCYGEVIARDPRHLQAHNNLATVLSKQGRSEEAAHLFRQAVAIDPDSPRIHSNLLYNLQYLDTVSSEELYREHLAWDACNGSGRYGKSWATGTSPDPERPLRIGYVSADFCNHPVGCFLAPVLPSHDRRQFTIHCYSDCPEEDSLTARLKAAAHVWKETRRLSDAELADVIRNDNIDILVDLAGHTADNRLPVFAMKPAPLQMTWAGYVGTTGLAAMDFLISDERQSPAGDEGLTSEQIIRLPDCYVCFDPPGYAPPVAPVPALTTGFVTFGCLNNLAKVTPETVTLWARLLAELPGSRLLLKTRAIECASVRERYQSLFAERGIAAERLLLRGGSPHREFLAAYGEVDIALDPFPYSGGLTTLEALWMGVPVITLGGHRFCSRHSVAHLTAAGLGELIADSPDSYLSTAAALAADLPRLAALRRGLRDRVTTSPLCDGPRFTRNLEEAFRSAWRQWCLGRR